jgi:ubiquinone/menaquinone biosynthesis C-methylase UbiE
MNRARSPFPRYLGDPPFRPTSLRHRFLAWLVQLPVQGFIWAFLSPRRDQHISANPSTDEVMSVYTREARHYDDKHHLTTRGQDTVWRREAASCVLTASQKISYPIRVLDLCTGTGLAVVEIVKILNEWEVPADITGVDLYEAMLAVARARIFPWPSERLRFEHGDATCLQYRSATFDIVTQVFGIGGIPLPDDVFRSVLRVLRTGGEYYFVDMHRPVQQFSGEWPFVGKWWRMPWLEAATYTLTTIPLALARLWGWRDPTLDFYRAPLATYQEDGQWYGFETSWFKIEVERWWLGLPFMPTARLLVRKIRISEEEAHQRLRAIQDMPSYSDESLR